MKLSILFKNAGLIVHKAPLEGDRSAENARTVLKTRHLEIPLDAAAAEVLVAYLQVMRAYLKTSSSSRLQVRLTFEKVATRLEQQLKIHGRTRAGCTDISELIKQMGCLHDWVSKRAASLSDPQIRD